MTVSFQLEKQINYPGELFTDTNLRALLKNPGKSCQSAFKKFRIRREWSFLPRDPHLLSPTAGARAYLIRSQGTREP